MRHLDVHRASERLARRYGRWPLSDAPLGTIIEDGGRPRIVLLEREGVYELVPRGWQLMAAPPPVDDVRVRLRHGLSRQRSTAWRVRRVSLPAASRTVIRSVSRTAASAVAQHPSPDGGEAHPRRCRNA